MIRDIAILICSRGREVMLARLIDDIDRAFAPALEAGGMSVVTFVYAQNYSQAYLGGLARRFAADIASGRLVIVEPSGPHQQIGYVVASAVTALHARVDYRLAMLMDDDSLYRSEAQVDANLAEAARHFLDHDDRAYSIKLGQSRSLEYWPFINAGGPIMPFKEKMLWCSRAVLEEALAFPEFAQLSVGEDAVLAAIAWRGGAERCCGVFGIATFLHLGFEADEEQPANPITGGYGELVGYDASRDKGSELGKYSAAYQSGTVPYSIMPEIFVGPDHPHYYINGIRPEAVTRYDVVDAGFHKLVRAG